MTDCSDDLCSPAASNGGSSCHHSYMMPTRQSSNSLAHLSNSQQHRGSLCDGSGNFFTMHDVDISRNHGHGTVPVPGRESHTADLTEFDRYVKIMEQADRLEQALQWDVEDDESTGGAEGENFNQDQTPPPANRAVAAAAAAYVKPPPKAQAVPIGMDIDMTKVESKVDDLSLNNGRLESVGSRDIGLEDSGPSLFNEAKQDDAPLPQDRRPSSAPPTQYPFNSKFWAYVRDILSQAKPVGFNELPNPKAAASKGPEDASNFLSKVIGIGPLNPIQPAVIAKEAGFDEDEVLAELLYATRTGLVAMRFAPECIQCGSAVMDTDMLGRVPSKALCNGCNSPNVIESLDNVKVMFLLNSDVLYVLAENYACTPSADSMSVTSVFAIVPANSTGSGFSYCIGTGKDTEIAPALEPGKYRMHCPVAKTDNYLVVKRQTRDDDKPVQLNMKVSELVHTGQNGKTKKELHVTHGRIQFDIFPDTRSFFVLWVQKDVDDKKLMFLPEDERPNYTNATKVIHHPIFNALFQENQVVSVQKDVFLSISNVVLVFTDIVDSTVMYASLGDGPAFRLVRKHFQVLFGAFTRNGGRVVKTIGDAVMASFTTGTAALAAVSEAMELLPTIGRRPDNNNYVEIRVGIHSGQATVVPLNGVNDYFGQTANIAARVQSAAKASECFVTETVLESSEGAREAYNEITGMGSSFKPTPLIELKLKGVAGKVHARGFRWLLRSRRASEASTSYMDRKVNRSYSARSSMRSIDSSGEDDFDRPGEMGRRGSTLDAHYEEN
ncbi:hypothetical protein ACHAXR_010801 [Thalassiosira sp. AJA248-18]